jgi:hypothetical protein
MKEERHVAHIDVKGNAHRVLVVNLERKRSLGICRHRWESSNKMILREIGWYVVDWINLAQKRDQWWVLVSMAMDLLVS